jgi:peptidoglycan hydrolase-like protein with peptidoglycan-binding domain
MRSRAFVIALAVLIASGLGVGVWQLTRDGDDGPDQVIVVEEVRTETLRDIVVLRGTIDRGERFTIYSGAGGRITDVAITGESVVAAGDRLLDIDDRPMIAVPGDGPLWRPLGPGAANGSDILLVEGMLAAAGLDPGPIDEELTEQTVEALRSWQRENGFPDDGVLRPNDLAVGDWPATVGRLPLEAGQFVGVGVPIVVLVEDELRALVSVDPTDRSRLATGLGATVEVPATGEAAAGVLVSLADAASPDAQGNPRYEGELLISGDLRAVAGTAVRVEVVIDEVADALVVPVASVSLAGDGTEEVRILTPNGTLTRVAVSTGLTQGALVQITSGLSGGEQVVVEVRSG